MVKKIILPLLSLTILLTACFSQETINNLETSDDANESMWADILQSQQIQIDELQEQMEEINNKLNAKVDLVQHDALYQQINILRTLLSTSDVVEELTGFVESIEDIDGTYVVKILTADFLTGDEAILAAMEEQGLPEHEVSLPNGFFLKHNLDDIRSYALNHNSLSYILENVMPVHKTQDEFINEESIAHRFFKFYIVDGQIAVIVEQYIP